MYGGFYMFNSFGNLDEARKGFSNVYKQCLSGEKTIIDLASIFLITLNKERIKNYYIKFICFSVPSITIVDKSTDVSYKAYFTSRIDMLDLCSDKIEYICVTIQRGSNVEEYFYRAFAKDEAHRLIASFELVDGRVVRSINLIQDEPEETKSFKITPVDSSSAKN